MISNWTGLPVFCWMMVDRFRMSPPLTTSADLEFDEVAATKLAIDGQIKQRSVPQSPVLIEIKPNGPDIARLQRALGADILPSIPGPPFMHGWVKV